MKIYLLDKQNIFAIREDSPEIHRHHLPDISMDQMRSPIHNYTVLDDTSSPSSLPPINFVSNNNNNNNNQINNNNNNNIIINNNNNNNNNNDNHTTLAPKEDQMNIVPPTNNNNTNNTQNTNNNIITYTNNNNNIILSNNNDRGSEEEVLSVGGPAHLAPIMNNNFENITLQPITIPPLININKVNNNNLFPPANTLTNLNTQNINNNNTLNNNINNNINNNMHTIAPFPLLHSVKKSQDDHPSFRPKAITNIPSIIPPHVLNATPIFENKKSKVFLLRFVICFFFFLVSIN